jgi:hypothetical protein
LSYIRILSTWNSFIDDKGIVSDEGVEFILPYLSEFIESWNAARSDSNTNGMTEEDKTEKVSMMSFGGAEAVSKATYYYYKKDENGKFFIEYSAALEIPEKMADRQLVYIPYASYVANWDHGYLAPNNDTYKDDIYLYRAPEAVYTYNGLSK